RLSLAGQSQPPHERASPRIPSGHRPLADGCRPERRYIPSEHNLMDAYLYDHLRTPRGKGRTEGRLHEITPIQLATQALAALRDRNALDTSRIDDVTLGCVMPVGEQ